MKIYVRYRGFSSIPAIAENPVLEMPEGSTVSDLYLQLGLAEEVHPNLQAFVNSDAAWKSTKLKDRDRVDIVTPVSGG